MRETLAQQTGATWILVFAVALAAFVLLFLFAPRRRTRSALGALQAEVSGAVRVAPIAEQPSPGVDDALVGLDSAAIKGAVRKAEARGQHEKLPSLYLALARHSLAAEEKADAEEFLRMAIRGAGMADQKDIHAKARLALGDAAHAGGDLTTACEHWQIARTIFLELKQRADHEAVETRMLRNGCPTDWVLTDF